MFSWFKKKNKTHDRVEILNKTLNLAMEFGKNWLQPTQDRMSKIYPELTSDELEENNITCQEAMKFGYNEIYTMAEKCGSRVNQKEFFKLFTEHYPWVSDKNMEHLFSQGMYYAWKDMGF